jgi:hypothetical protein
MRPWTLAGALALMVIGCGGAMVAPADPRAAWCGGDRELGGRETCRADRAECEADGLEACERFVYWCFDFGEERLERVCKTGRNAEAECRQAAFTHRPVGVEEQPCFPLEEYQ